MILKLQNVKIGGSLARNAGFDAHVSSQVSGFPVASPCLWGKLQNLGFSKVSKEVVMSVCVAGVALREILMCLQTANVSKVVLCGRRNTFASFSEDAWHFSWQAQHFGDLHRHFAWQAQHLVRIRRVWNAILRGRRSISDTPHSTLYTPHFTLHTLHSTLYTLHFALPTLHPTLYTTLYTLTLYTSHPTL